MELLEGKLGLVDLELLIWWFGERAGRLDLRGFNDK